MLQKHTDKILLKRIFQNRLFIWHVALLRQEIMRDKRSGDLTKLTSAEPKFDLEADYRSL
jgi:hypothetical protein